MSPGAPLRAARPRPAITRPIILSLPLVGLLLWSGWSLALAMPERGEGFTLPTALEDTRQLQHSSHGAITAALITRPAPRPASTAPTDVNVAAESRPACRQRWSRVSRSNCCRASRCPGGRADRARCLRRRSRRLGADQRRPSCSHQRGSDSRASEPVTITCRRSSARRTPPQRPPLVPEADRIRVKVVTVRAKVTAYTYDHAVSKPEWADGIVAWHLNGKKRRVEAHRYGLATDWSQFLAPPS